MKNIILIIATSLLSLQGFAQYREPEEHREPEEEREGGFKKDHLFTGGGIQLSYSGYSFVVGASPVIGYSFTKWFDAGIGLNFTYISSRQAEQDQFGDIYTTGDKVRQTDIAPIVFARLYPLKFLFVQAQGEQNFISQKYIYGGNSIPDEKIKYSVTSLLLGAGYCSGREAVGDLFYYISWSFDVLKDRRSPYVQQVANGSVSILPILRAGIQIPLFQGGGRRD